MIRSRHARRTFGFFVFTLAIPMFVLGCPKKPQPVVEDAAPPPPATSSGPLVLAPLEDDAGDAGDGDAADAHPKGSGPGLNPNQLKIKACCNSMRAQAKQMGASPEAFQMNTLAAQCDQIAAQVGPAGNAPEFAQLRQILKSVKLPSACTF
jgi:hypothetical protein